MSAGSKGRALRDPTLLVKHPAGVPHFLQTRDPGKDSLVAASTKVINPRQFTLYAVTKVRAMGSHRKNTSQKGAASC